MVRGKLGRLQRMTISSLIVIDVHAINTIQLLIDQQISTVYDFDWNSQMRYY